MVAPRTLSLLALAGAAAAAAALQNPRAALNAAASDGDFRAARKVILENPVAAVDLDAALACAAKRSHVHVMAFLVDSGAADLDRALVQAAIRNQVQACVWLIDEARYAPAEALEAAQLAASAACATDAEWLLISERIAAKRRERKKRRGRFDDLF